MEWIKTEKKMPETKAVDETYSTSGWLLGFWNNADKSGSSFGAVIYERHVIEGVVRHHWVGEMLDECLPPDYWAEVDYPS